MPTSLFTVFGIIISSCQVEINVLNLIYVKYPQTVINCSLDIVRYSCISPAETSFLQQSVKVEYFGL